MERRYAGEGVQGAVEPVGRAFAVVEDLALELGEDVLTIIALEDLHCESPLWGLSLGVRCTPQRSVLTRSQTDRERTGFCDEADDIGTVPGLDGLHPLAPVNIGDHLARLVDGLRRCHTMSEVKDSRVATLP
jgi:hypothetical protein